MNYTYSIKEKRMDTLQIRLTDAHKSALAKLVRRGLYPSRAEAVRAAVRDLLDKHEQGRRA